jgi:hypothetical protein
MAKAIQHLSYQVEDTAEAGEPDKVEYNCLIVDGDDSSMSKRVRGKLESPDFSKTCQQMYNDIKTQIETDEGIA